MNCSARIANKYSNSSVADLGYSTRPDYGNDYYTILLVLPSSNHELKITLAVINQVAAYLGSGDNARTWRYSNFGSRAIQYSERRAYQHRCKNRANLYYASLRVPN